MEDKTQTVKADVPVVGEELQVRKRRRLRKAASTELAADKGKVSLVESGMEQREEPVVAGSPTFEELDQHVDELLAHPFVSEVVDEGEIDKDQEGQRDGKEVDTPGKIPGAVRS
ncbi:hypothetical protein Dimus_033323 [Dionaea muscipula]